MCRNSLGSGLPKTCSFSTFCVDWIVVWCGNGVLKSDFFTHVRDIPPQYGPGYADDNAETKAAAEYISGKGDAWKLPLQLGPNQVEFAALQNCCCIKPSTFWVSPEPTCWNSKAQAMCIYHVVELAQAWCALATCMMDIAVQVQTSACFRRARTYSLFVGWLSTFFLKGLWFLMSLLRTCLEIVNVSVNPQEILSM